MLKGSGRTNSVRTEITWPVQVYCYRKVLVLEQIKASLRRKNYREAISLLEEFVSDGEISKDIISLVYAQLGFLFFFDLRFKDAVNHFLLSETAAIRDISHSTSIISKKGSVDTVVDKDFLSNPPSRADLLELAIRNIIR
jgi:vacuolar protein sorting-associated protein 3